MLMISSLVLLMLFFVRNFLRWCRLNLKWVLMGELKLFLGIQINQFKYWNMDRKILVDLEVFRGVVPERDQLEFTVRNRCKKFRVERILLLPFLFLKAFLGEPRVKFDQVCIQSARSSFPFVLSRFPGLGNRVLGFVSLDETSPCSFDVSVGRGDDAIFCMVFQLQMSGWTCNA